MCPHEEKVTAWLLGDLPPEEQQAITRHLEACASCRVARDELAGVLGPLQSGLAKDRVSVRPRAAGTRPVEKRDWSVTRFLNAAWVRRAALFAISCGTLVSVVALIQRQTNRARRTHGVVTHMTFHKAEADNTPELAPVKPGQGADSVPFDVDAFRPDTSVTLDDGRTIDMPALPDRRTDPASRFPGLVSQDGLNAVERALAKEPATFNAPEFFNDGGLTKTKHVAERAVPAPPSNLKIKPIEVAGRPPPSLSSTNTPAATNQPAASTQAHP